RSLRRLRLPGARRGLRRRELRRPEPADLGAALPEGLPPRRRAGLRARALAFHLGVSFRAGPVHPAGASAMETRDLLLLIGFLRSGKMFPAAVPLKDLPVHRSLKILMDGIAEQERALFG